MSDLKVTEVKVFKASGNAGVILANGTATFNEAFFVRFTIMNGKNGPFVKWPSHKGKDAEGADKWYPEAGFVVNEEAEDKYATKNELEKEIIDEFNKVLAITPKEKPKDEPAPVATGGGTTPTKKTKKPAVNWRD
jgi:DNA-binding cell septation regulator SpoVG